MTRTPRLANSLHTSTRPSSKNCASSIPTTSISVESSNILADESTGVDAIELLSCDTTSSMEYRVSMAGLKISTFCRANCARFILRMSSSVLPENIEPHITSMRPRRWVSITLSSEKSAILLILSWDKISAKFRFSEDNTSILALLSVRNLASAERKCKFLGQAKC